MDYKKAAQDILKALGGKDNVAAAAHCSTRLRLVLHDEGKVDEAKLNENDLVKGTFTTGGQYQVIIGAGTVNLVYKELAELTGLSEMSTKEVSSAGNQKMNPLQRFVKMLSDIFVPIIPAIVAGGLLMGINNLLTAKDFFIEGKSVIEAYPEMADLAALINTFANAAFVFLPILIGFSAAKRFGGNPYLGAALGMLMVHPDLLNGYGYADAVANNEVPVWSIFGYEIEKVGYQGTVLPILVSAFILSKIEVFLRKRVPSFLDNLITPLVAIFVTGILTFVFVGPFTRGAGNLLTDSLVWLYDTTGMIGGAIFGLLYAPIVITGMHHSFIAVETQLIADIAKTGGSFIFPVAAMSNVAQGGATLAAFLLVKDAKTKGVASAAGISALLGITEPALFGVNLKYGFPFICGMIGSGIAAIISVGSGVMANAIGIGGLPGILSIQPNSIPMFAVAMVVAIAVPFILTVVVGRKKLNAV